MLVRLLQCGTKRTLGFMDPCTRGTPWKKIFFMLGLFMALGALVYPFMASRIEQREAACGESCSKKGFNGYRYSPPRGVRPVRQDHCECVNIK